MADLYKSEFSKDHDIPLAHLDYGYIETCNNIKELEKILKVLRSGDEGRYPQLEEFCEKKIEAMNPKSRVLRKSRPVSTPRDLEQGEWSEIQKDLKDWQSEIKQVEETLKTTSADADLPPVRGSGANIKVETVKDEPGPTAKGKKKRVKPRDYREWDKIDIDAELEKVDNNQSVTKENKCTLRHSSKPNIPSTIESSNLTDQQKIQKAEREKEKGNEAFRSGDFSEALVYYNRSLSLIPTVACRNNRAQTYIKLSKWEDAISDCDAVLKVEPENMKALLRRGVAHQGKHDWNSAKSDLQNVLKKEPTNKRAMQILEEVEKSIAEKKKQGRRLVIEEVEEMSENEDEKVDESTTSSASPKEDTPKIQELDSSSQGNKTEEKSAQEISENSPEEKSDVKPQGKKGKHKNRKKKQRKENKSSDDGAAATSEVNVEPPTGDHTEEKNQVEDEKSVPESSPSSAPTPSLREPPAPTTPVHTPPAEAVPTHTTATTAVPVHTPPPPAPLPAVVEKIKADGNEMFRKGRYGEAKDLYTKVIEKLLKKKPAQDHNLCLLYSNRSNCYIKMGDVENCAKDCNAALEINPASIKPLVRRAAAYEAMEKFRKAYLDYRQVLYLDRSLDVANQGLNRCSKMLQQMDGPKWREKLPSMKILSTPTPSFQMPVTTAPSSGTPPNLPTETAVPPLDNEEKFDELKGKGNQHVQKGEFAEALECYTQCITLFADRTVPYTNRALCNLRLNKPSLVISDCTTALSHEPTNVKALFRRAQAFKMQEQYTSSQSDLENLLKIDPKNAPAKRELQLVKTYIAENKKKQASSMDAASLEEKRKQIEAEVAETRRQMAAAAAKVEQEKKRMKDATAAVEKNKADLKAASAAVDETKKQLHQDKQKLQEKERKRCKIQIQETDESSSEPEEEIEVMKSVNKTGATKAGGPKVQQDVQNQKPKQEPQTAKVRVDMSKSTAIQSDSSDSTPYLPPEPSPQPPPVTPGDSPCDEMPPSPTPPGQAPTPYEFIHTWSTLKPSMGPALYAKLLEQIDTDDLPKVISNKLDGDMLSIIIKCVDLFIDQGLASRCLAILQKIVSVPRFEMVTMFMTSSDKKELNSVLDRLAEWGSCSYLDEDLKKLRKAYSLA